MIQISNLSFYYKKSAPIFEGVTLQIKSGIYGLLGENGVGKTTLLHIISGLRFPKSGSCNVCGYESYKRKPGMLSQLFFLPEEFNTPSESISTYAKLNGVFYPNFKQSELDEYLDIFQVDRQKKMTQMSFGQKKKAMIAFAIAANTPVLLLDEPTNGLDIPSKSQFRKIISSVSTSDKSIVISTHQVRDLENLIDPIIILDRNRVLLNNTVEEITQKLHFTYSATKPQDSLYCEQILQGYSAVSENVDNEESILNIEALFSAVVLNKEKIKNIFNN